MIAFQSVPGLATLYMQVVLWYCIYGQMLSLWIKYTKIKFHRIMQVNSKCYELLALTILKKIMEIWTMAIKYLKRLLVVGTLMFYSTANAMLIDKGNFTTDSSTDLDWLDLSETAGMSYSQALSNNYGWRHASHVEVENIFGLLFDGYYDTDTTGHWSDTVDNEYSNQTVDVNSFLSLFGVVSEYIGPDSTRSYSYGLYSRGESIYGYSFLRSMGVFSSTDGRNRIDGMEYSTAFTTSFTGPGHGTYLVRNSVVPVPGAIWLFGSALIGLAGAAMRKTRI